MLKNKILGVSKGLGKEALANWYYSARKVNADQVLIVLDKQVPDLSDFSDLHIVHYPTGEIDVHHERYLYGWKYLQDHLDDYVLWTDVTDVVFQSDPFVHKTDRILIGEEGLSIKEEHWNRTNIKKSFPQFYDAVAEMPVLCSGVMMGSARLLSDLFYQIYNFCTGIRIKEDINIIDQAALNVLQATNDFKSKVQLTNTNDSFVVHCAVSGPVPISLEWSYPKVYHYNLPIFDFDSKRVYTKAKELISIVHQYNRIPGWKYETREDSMFHNPELSVLAG